MNNVTPISEDSDPQTSSPAIAEAMRWGRRTRFNPLRSLTAGSLTRALDSFDVGELREAALLWSAIADRDDTIPSVKAKREKAIAYQTLETIALEKSDAAEAHRAVLEDFWRHARYVSAWDRSDTGGVRKLIRRMQEAVSYRYAVHHIVWRPTPSGLRATFEYVPLWFFEARDARLRFLPQGFGLDGIELDPDEWLISSGDGLMMAASIGYFCKRATLQDWLRFSEKFSQPGVLGRTPAKKGTDEGDAMQEAVRRFGNEWVAVLYGDSGSGKSGIELIQADGNPASMPMPALIERVDRKIAALYRGADLSTMSSGGGEGTGASLQGEEQAILERADATERSEELQRVERTVIRWHFGDEVEPLAQTRLIVPEREDQRLLLEAVKTFVDLGVKLPVGDTIGHYGLSEATDEDTVLQRAGETESTRLETGENAAHDGWRFQQRDADGKWTKTPGGDDSLYKISRDILNKQGGFTLDAKTKQSRTSGYAVAPDKDTEQAVPYEDFDESTLRSYIRSKADLLMRDRAHLGGWLHEGNVYLDVSIVVEDRAEAEALAIAGDQIAYYNLSTGEEIKTPKDHDRRQSSSNSDLPGGSEDSPVRSTDRGRDDRPVRRSDGRTGEGGRNDPARRIGESGLLGGDRALAEDARLIRRKIAISLVDSVIDGVDPDFSPASDLIETEGNATPAGDSDRLPSYGTAPNAAAVTPDSDGWYQIAPYGEWPTVDKRYVQVFGREQAEKIVRHYNSLPFRITRWLTNKEVPVFIGHPDVDRKLWPDERKLAPKHRRLEAREDGLWGQAAWNAAGHENLENGYWQYPSPVWLFPPPKPGTNRVFPDLLQSVGLTNFQNTPHARRVTHNATAATGDQPKHIIMNEELIAELKLEEGATIEDVLAAVRALKEAAKTAKKTATEAEEKSTAANAALETAQSELSAMRETTANALLDSKIEDGSITKAEKTGWQRRFEADYEAAANALGEVKPSERLNTKSVDLPDKPTAAPATAAERIAAVNAAVAAEMNRNGGDYDLAHAAVKADTKMKPIFEAMSQASEEDED